MDNNVNINIGGNAVENMTAELSCICRVAGVEEGVSVSLERRLCLSRLTFCCDMIL